MDSEMLKVMVVDDEEIARNFLKKCIDWEQIQMQIVCEASSGREALDLIEEYRPDIVFTDIQMPFMDGMELSRMIAETYPHIRIVILTAHKEFDYAKKGIKIGISDFLLKPINKAEVYRIANSLKERIGAERRHWNEFQSMKKQLEENLAYLKEKFLMELLVHSSGMEDLDEKQAYFYPGTASGKFQIALLETTHSEMVADVHEEKKLLLGLKSLELVKQYFREDPKVDIFFDNSRRIVIYAMDPQLDLEECAEQLKSLIINRIKCFVSIGIGSAVDSIQFVNQSYREAMDALKFSIVYGRNHVVSFRDDLFFNAQNWRFREDEIREIGFCIKAGLEEKAASVTDSMYDVMAAGVVTIEQVRVVSINIISVILSTLGEMGLSCEEVLKGEKIPYAQIFEIDTLQDMKTHMKGTIAQIIHAIQTLRSRKSRKITDDIQAYMKANLSSFDLSLASVAHAFFINPSYLSRVFKQETEQSFTEYLSRIRMEKAITMLNETDLKAYRIAEEVGIKDPYYFSNVFKKFTGVSIQDYRKR